MDYKNFIYAVSCLLFSITIGGAVYEHIAVVPAWSAAPPSSLTMFQGQYGLNAAPFWMAIHPVAIVFLTLSLITSWKTDRKFNLITTLVGYILILVATATYFVPELLEIINTPYSETVDVDLTKRAGTWETLSIVRLVILIGLSLILYSGLTKSSLYKSAQY